MYISELSPWQVSSIVRDEVDSAHAKVTKHFDRQLMKLATSQADAMVSLSDSIDGRLEAMTEEQNANMLFLVEGLDRFSKHVSTSLSQIGRRVDGISSQLRDIADDVANPELTRAKERARRAQQALTSGQVERAAELIESAINPKDTAPFDEIPAFHRLRTQIQVARAAQASSAEEARKILEEVLFSKTHHLDPGEFFDVRLAYADAYYYAGDFENALGVLAKCHTDARGDKDHPRRSRLASILYSSARCALKAGKIGLAEQALETYFKRDWAGPAKIAIDPDFKDHTEMTMRVFAKFWDPIKDEARKNFEALAYVVCNKGADEMASVLENILRISSPPGFPDATPAKVHLERATGTRNTPSFYKKMLDSRFHEASVAAFSDIDFASAGPLDLELARRKLVENNWEDDYREGRVDVMRRAIRQKVAYFNEMIPLLCQQKEQVEQGLIPEGLVGKIREEKFKCPVNTVDHLTMGFFARRKAQKEYEKENRVARDVIEKNKAAQERYKEATRKHAVPILLPHLEEARQTFATHRENVLRAHDAFKVYREMVAA